MMTATILLPSATDVKQRGSTNLYAPADDQDPRIAFLRALFIIGITAFGTNLLLFWYSHACRTVENRTN